MNPLVYFEIPVADMKRARVFYERVFEVSLEILLKAGADPRAIDKAGKTPLDVAKPEYRDILSKAMMDKPLK